MYRNYFNYGYQQQYDPRMWNGYQQQYNPRLIDQPYYESDIRQLNWDQWNWEQSINERRGNIKTMIRGLELSDETQQAMFLHLEHTEDFLLDRPENFIRKYLHMRNFISDRILRQALQAKYRIISEILSDTVFSYYLLLITYI